jgi:hypothetical protein
MRDYYPEIERLVIDTFALWDVTRVGFSWRKYYLDHTRQVQHLALRMGEALDGDPEELRLAAILHDVTKRYDGQILKQPDGRPMLDGEGLWLNETIAPARENRVTALYERLCLQGQIHHVSGAIITEGVLEEFGLPANAIRPVAKIVRGHLKGKAPLAVLDERYREVEVRILYDADTIDPNVGLPAFYRNIQINAGRALETGQPVILAEYVRNLPRWVGAKESFRDEMLTPVGREICERRLTGMHSLARAAEAELADGALNRRWGLLGVLDYLFTNPEDPSLWEHADGLERHWLPEREAALRAEGEPEAAAAALERSRAFITALRREMLGG